MKYLYYPGCSLHGTGRAYDESLLAVFDALKVPYEELRDWNCCGATSYMSVDEVKAHTLAARNLALAELQMPAEATGGEPVQVIAPCSACFLALVKSARCAGKTSTSCTGPCTSTALAIARRPRTRERRRRPRAASQSSPRSCRSCARCMGRAGESAM